MRTNFMIGLRLPHEQRPPEGWPLSGQILHYGQFSLPLLAVNVLCANGRRYSVRLSGTPDTFFSIPGRVQVRGVTVSGFIWTRSDGQLCFTAKQGGKHAALLIWPPEVVDSGSALPLAEKGKSP